MMIKKRLAKETLVSTSLMVIILFSLAPVDYLHAETDKGKVTGFIYRKDDKTPLWGAQVLLSNVKTGELFESNVTDSSGDYELKRIPAGDYLVSILSKDRPYQVRKIDFYLKVFAGKTTNASFALRKVRKMLFFRKPCFWTFVLTAIALGVILI